jgi:hypothetical protein
MIAFNFRRALAGVTMLGTLLMAAQKSGAQTPAARFVDSARVEMDRALRDMDPVRIDRTIVMLDRALVAFPDDPYLLHYRGYALYWKAAGAFMGGKKEQATPFVKEGLANLAKSADRLPWAETIQLEASMNGFLIAIDPGNGPTLGPLTGRLTAEATKLAPDNPRVLLLQAYLAEATPPSMGGGKTRAKELASRAVAAFANDHPGPLAPAWGKDEATDMVRRLSRANGSGMP